MMNVVIVSDMASLESVLHTARATPAVSTYVFVSVQFRYDAYGRASDFCIHTFITCERIGISGALTVCCSNHCVSQMIEWVAQGLFPCSSIPH